MKAEMSYSNAEQRQRMVNAEHELTDERVRKIIALKREVSALCHTLAPIASSHPTNVRMARCAPTGKALW